MLGRLADQPCERDERQRGEDEERVLAEVGDVVEDDEERPESQQSVEEAADQGRGHPILWRVLRAVLFDWGDTLFHFAYDEVLLAAGWEAGLDTLERDGLPSPERTAAVFRERYLPLLFVPGRSRGGRVPGDGPRASRGLRCRGRRGGA